jgi:hypothetical protein
VVWVVEVKVLCSDCIRMHMPSEVVYNCVDGGGIVLRVDNPFIRLANPCVLNEVRSDLFHEELVLILVHVLAVEHQPHDDTVQLLDFRVTVAYHGSLFKNHCSEQCVNILHSVACICLICVHLRPSIFRQRRSYQSHSLCCNS